MIGAIVILPLVAVFTVGLFFFVYYIPEDIGIYLGWIPSLIFFMLAIFADLLWLIGLVMVLSIYITATALRILKNRKRQQMEEARLKEIDKMSISDL